MPSQLAQHYASKIKNDPKHQYVKVCTGRFYDKTGALVPKAQIKDMSKVKLLKPVSDKVKEKLASKPVIKQPRKPKSEPTVHTPTTSHITGTPLSLKVVKPLRKKKETVTHTIPHMVQTHAPTVTANTNRTIPHSNDFVVQGPPINMPKPLNLNVIRNAGARRGGTLSQPSNGLISGIMPKRPVVSRK